MEGSFSRTSLDYAPTQQTGQSWSGSLTTTRESARATTNNGGTVSIDPAGHVTTSGLSNNDASASESSITYDTYNGEHLEDSYVELNGETHNRVFKKRDQQVESYATTSKNTPAQGPDQPATQSSTNTHDWEIIKRNDTIDVSHYHQDGDPPLSFEGDSDTTSVSYHDRHEKGNATQTVTLAGDKASASINSHSTIHDVSGGRELTTARYYDTAGIQDQRVRASINDLFLDSSTSSTYHSSHTVDAEGHAHGGTFSAESHTREESGPVYWSYRNENGRLMVWSSPYSFVSESTLPPPEIIDSPAVTTTTDDVTESGWYEDWMIPFINVAIRIQGGRSQQTIHTRQEKDFASSSKGVNADNTWQDNTSTVSTFHKEFDDSTRTNHTVYGPLGDSTTSTFSRDYEKHTGSTNYRTPGYYNSDHDYDKQRTDHEIHVTDGTTRGKEHDFHAWYHGPNDYNDGTHTTTDLFETQPAPTPPSAPPSFAGRHAPNEAGGGETTTGGGSSGIPNQHDVLNLTLKLSPESIAILKEYVRQNELAGVRVGYTSTELIERGISVAKGEAEYPSQSLDPFSAEVIDHGIRLGLESQTLQSPGILRPGYYDEFGWHRTFCMSCHDPNNRNSQLKMSVAQNTLNNSWEYFVISNAIYLAAGSAMARLAPALGLAAETAGAARVAAPEAVSLVTSEGTANAAQYAKLKEFYRLAEKYGTGGTKKLDNGRFRFYGGLRAPRTPGEMIGQRVVREWNPANGNTRTWLETLDQSGRIRIVRPETGGPKVHYLFDAEGNYVKPF